MAMLQAVYYRDAHGTEPVQAFLDQLDDNVAATLANQIARLNLLSEEEPHLPFPHSSQIDGELRELRCHYGKRLFRVLYRRSGNLFVLLHAFPKRTAKVPASEIEIARERWNHVKARMDADPRVPPRPAGHDAP